MKKNETSNQDAQLEKEIYEMLTPEQQMLWDLTDSILLQEIVIPKRRHISPAEAIKNQKVLSYINEFKLANSKTK